VRRRRRQFVARTPRWDGRAQGKTAEKKSTEGASRAANVGSVDGQRSANECANMLAEGVTRCMLGITRMQLLSERPRTLATVFTRKVQKAVERWTECSRRRQTTLLGFFLRGVTGLAETSTNRVC
jgi:hypothetical protein